MGLRERVQGFINGLQSEHTTDQREEFIYGMTREEIQTNLETEGLDYFVSVSDLCSPVSYRTFVMIRNHFASKLGQVEYLENDEYRIRFPREWSFVSGRSYSQTPPQLITSVQRINLRRLASSSKRQIDIPERESTVRMSGAGMRADKRIADSVKWNKIMQSKEFPDFDNLPITGEDFEREYENPGARETIWLHLPREEQEDGTYRVTLPHPKLTFLLDGYFSRQVTEEELQNWKEISERFLNPKKIERLTQWLRFHGVSIGERSEYRELAYQVMVRLIPEDARSRLRELKKITIDVPEDLRPDISGGKEKLTLRRKKLNRIIRLLEGNAHKKDDASEE